MSKEKNKTELPKVMEGELQARLIKLREDAGYDLPQMAAILCLSEEVIVNLENEAFDLLPEPPYVRGYLRNYAKLSDEDASELINRYESLRGANADELNFQIKSTHTIKTGSQKRLSPIWTQVIMLVVLLGGIAALSTIPEVKTWFSEQWNNFSSQLEPSNVDNNPSLLGQLPVPTPLPGDNPTGLQQTNNVTDSSTSSAPTESLSTSNQSTSTQSTTAENTTSENTLSTSNSPETSSENTLAENNLTKNNLAESNLSKSNLAENTLAVNNQASNSSSTELTTNNITETNQTSAETEAITSTNLSEESILTDPNGLINIKLTFNKEVWLRIKDKDNKTVFEGLNKEGTEKTIDLSKPLTFRVGNAQGLSLIVDNKAVDISTYINGSIANFTLE